MSKTLLFNTWLLAFCLLLSFTSALHSQEMTVNVQQFGVEEGLLHRDVTLFKDSKGLLWLGSPAGFQRYDGYSFKNYESPEEGFIFNRIGELPSGELWFLHGGGEGSFFFFNPETGIAKRQSDYYDPVYVAELHQLSKQYELAFSSSETISTFYFQAAGKLIGLSLTQGKFEIDLPFEEQYYTVHHIDSRGTARIKVKGQLKYHFVDIKEQLPPNFEVEEYFSRFVSKWGDNLFFAGYHHRLLGLKDGIFSLDTLGQEHLIYTEEEGYRFHQLIGHRAWFNRDTGWKIIDVLTGEKIELLTSDYGPELFGYVSYKFSYADGPNRVYTCSEFGFNIIDLEPNLFSTYFNKDADYELPFKNSIRGITVKGNRMLFCAEQTGVVSQNLATPEDFEAIFKKYPFSLARGGYIDIIQSSQGDYWLTSSKYFFKLDSLLRPVEEYPYDNVQNKNLVYYKSWVVFEDAQQCIWTADQRGINKVCNGLLKRYPFQKLKDRQVLQIVQKDASTLWLCADDGLLTYDLDSMKVTHIYAKGQTGKYYLPATNIRAMLVEENGDIWLASARGLIYWSAQTGKKQLFNRLNGLVNENLYAVYADKHHRLWVSSDYGIMSFDKTSHQVTPYLPKDGIGQEEFNRVAHFQTEDGRIFFGGLNGITAFHPDDFVKVNHDHRAMVLTEFEVFDGEIEALTNKLPDGNRAKVIDFKPADRFMKLAFTLPTYEEKNKILYGWKLEGVFDEWTYQKENHLQFASLPYGTHTLRIKGQSTLSGWSPHELAIRINVIKPVYLRTWFIVALLLALIAGVVAFFQLRTRLLKREIAKATATIQQQTKELRELDQLKSRFFANVSHELRTPLALMLGPIKRLRLRHTQQKEDQMLLGFLERNTIHLRGLVNEILDLSKLENNKLELRPEPTSLLQYLNNHLNQYYSIGDSERVLVTGAFHIDPDLQVMLDRNKFEKILNNLLSNAIKFTPPHGKVEIMASETEDLLCFSVTDNGRGIHPDDLPHIFNRFYQSKQADAPTEGGTGIGLSMTSELTLLMSGRIWVESSLGQGSTFYLEVPKVPVTELIKVSRQELDLAASGTASSPNSENGAHRPEIYTKARGKARILVVEDNKDLREYYQLVLEGYQVELTEHGQEALDYLAKGELPDLIISDMMMPVMDGIQLLERLKASDDWRHLPVIMLTARTNRQDRIKALRFGLDDYLNKPFDEEELLVRINNLLLHSAARASSENGRTSKTPKPGLSQAELDWLEQLEGYILEHLDQPGLSVAGMADQFAMSESTLLRQLKKLTGLTPNHYLREIKLNQAQFFLHNRTYRNVAEVAFRVGFKDPTSFSRSYKKRFGKAPTEVLV